MKVITDEGFTPYTGERVIALCEFAQHRFETRLNNRLLDKGVTEFPFQEEVLKALEYTIEDVIVIELQSKMLNPKDLARFPKTAKKTAARKLVIMEEE